MRSLAGSLCIFVLAKFLPLGGTALRSERCGRVVFLYPLVVPPSPSPFRSLRWGSRPRTLPALARGALLCSLTVPPSGAGLRSLSGPPSGVRPGALPVPLVRPSGARSSAVPACVCLPSVPVGAHGSVTLGARGSAFSSLPVHERPCMLPHHKCTPRVVP